MSKRYSQAWMKHADFVLIDFICLQLSFVLAFWFRFGFVNPYAQEDGQTIAVLLVLCQLVVILFSRNYNGILRRTKSEEFLAVAKYLSWIIILSLVFLYATHDIEAISRLQLGYICLLYLFLDFVVRSANKSLIFRKSEFFHARKSMVLITSSELLPDAWDKLYHAKGYRDFSITEILLMDAQDEAARSRLEATYGPFINNLDEDAIRQMGHEWVDEVFLLQPDNMPFPTWLIRDLMAMGITTHYMVAAMAIDSWSGANVRKLGDYTVLTSTVHFPRAIRKKRR